MNVIEFYRSKAYRRRIRAWLMAEKAREEAAYGKPLYKRIQDSWKAKERP